MPGEGFIACVTRRSADRLQPLVERIRADGGQAHGLRVGCARGRGRRAGRRIERDIAPVEVAVFNIGANVRFGITETTERVYRKVWEMAALAGFLVEPQVARKMLRQRGTIIFTGATASLRGGAGFCAFAGAKHAARAGAEHGARAGAEGHPRCAHTVIDGAIDTAFIAQNFP